MFAKKLVNLPMNEFNDSFRDAKGLILMNTAGTMSYSPRCIRISTRAGTAPAMIHIRI
jgi:hypothetical protein